MRAGDRPDCHWHDGRSWTGPARSRMRVSSTWWWSGSGAAAGPSGSGAVSGANSGRTLTLLVRPDQLGQDSPGTDPRPIGPPGRRYRVITSPSQWCPCYTLRGRRPAGGSPKRNVVFLQQVEAGIRCGCLGSRCRMGEAGRLYPALDTNGRAGVAGSGTRSAAGSDQRWAHPPSAFDADGGVDLVA